MRIFVTGGTGFVGKHLVKKLGGQEHELRLLSRNPEKCLDLESESTKFILGNLSDITKWKDEVKEFNPQAAIHLAWEGIPDYSSAASIKNLVQGINLYSLLMEAGCQKIISTGSCWEYSSQKGCLLESTAINPHNAFASAKHSLYWMGKYLAEEKKVQFDWLRLFYVYGPGQRKDALIPYIIHCIEENRKPEIKTPTARNDFVYVGDVADAIAAVLADDTKSSALHPKSSIYNVGSGTLTSVGKIIDLVYARRGMASESICLEDKSEIAHNCSWADLTKIREKVGWEPKVGIEEGISRMIAAGEFGG